MFLFPDQLLGWGKKDLLNFAKWQLQWYDRNTAVFNIFAVIEVEYFNFVLGLTASILEVSQIYFV